MLIRLGAILFLLSTGVAQSPQAPFSLTITTSQTENKTGSEVRVTVTLTNTSNRQIMIGVTSGMCDYSVEVRDRGDKLAPATKYKRAINCGVLGRNAFEWLKPHEATTEEIAVSHFFDMSQPGEYSVLVARRPTKEFGNVVVKSNTLKITVTP